MPTKLEANASFRKPRLVFLVLALALVFGAVFVGGVSGAEFNVYTENDLRSAVTTSNGNGEDDLIIIRANIVLYNSDPIEITTGQITIQNEYGKSYTISRDDSSYSERILWVVSRYSPIFSVTGGEFILGGAASGSLILHGDDKIITNPGGGAIYVNGGSFVLNDGVSITEFGLLGSELSGDGAVYIDSGSFTMNGGSITNCVSMRGSGVYVSSDGRFEMMGGEITTNGHNNILWGIIDSTYGGGIYVEDGGWMSLSDINLVHDNLGDPQIVYSNPETSTTYTVEHHLETADKGRYVEDDTLRQIVSATSGKNTEAEALLIPGYAKPETISVTQKRISADGSTVVIIEYPRSISYVVTIPDTLVISEDTNTGSMDITVGNLWIPKENAVSVTVSSPTELKNLVLKDSSATLSYSLTKGGNTVLNHGEVARFTMDIHDSVTLSASYSGTPLYSGEYSDTLTFRATCIENGAVAFT